MIECSGNSILVLLSCTHYNCALVSCPDLGPSPCKGTITAQVWCFGNVHVFWPVVGGCFLSVRDTRSSD